MISCTISPYKPLILIRREAVKETEYKQDITDEEQQKLQDDMYDINNYEYNGEDVKLKIENDSLMNETYDEEKKDATSTVRNVNERKESKNTKRPVSRSLEKKPRKKRQKKMPILTKYVMKEVIKYAVSELYFDTYLFDKAKQMAEDNEKGL